MAVGGWRTGGGQVKGGWCCKVPRCVSCAVPRCWRSFVRPFVAGPRSHLYANVGHVLSQEVLCDLEHDLLVRPLTLGPRAIEPARLLLRVPQHEPHVRVLLVAGERDADLGLGHVVRSEGGVAVVVVVGGGGGA